METRASEQRTYAVTWHDGRGPARPGKLELRAEGVRLETGGPNGHLRVLALRYGAVATVRMACGRERLGGCPTLVLERPGKDAVVVMSVAGVGALSELGELLAFRTRPLAA